MTASALAMSTIEAAHSTIREVVIAGALGALAVALWFLLIDGIAGRACIRLRYSARWYYVRQIRSGHPRVQFA